MRTTCRSVHSSRFAGVVLVTSAIAVMIACGEVSQNPLTPSATSSFDSAVSPGTSTSIGAEAKVDICHRTKGTKAFVAISVAASALEAHVAHGDVPVGDPVPGSPGMIFGPLCTPVAGQNATITFADLLTDNARVSSYTESDFTVLASLGEWVARTTYGAPAPFIEFEAAGGTSVTGQLTVSAGDSGLFHFASVDLYSSVTTIPYALTGIRDSATVFTVTGTVPNTFGDFAPVQNPHSADLIDTLLITLTNAAPDCCDNPMGLDNIVLTR